MQPRTHGNPITGGRRKKLTDPEAKNGATRKGGGGGMDNLDGPGLPRQRSHETGR